MELTDHAKEKLGSLMKQIPKRIHLSICTPMIRTVHVVISQSLRRESVAFTSPDTFCESILPRLQSFSYSAAHWTGSLSLPASKAEEVQQ